MSEDLSHDLHLRAALRHAPDHALVPPAGVSQTILDAARQVHKPSRPAATPAPAVRVTVAPPRAIAWLRQWFSSPRLAGGLATGLVAALGLGLWIDLGLEPVIEPGPVRAAKEPRRREATLEPERAAQTPSREPGPVTSTRPDAPAAPPAAAEAARARRSQRVAEAKVERAPASAAPPAPAELRQREGDGARAAAPAAPPVAEPAPSVAEASAAQKPAARALAEALLRDGVTRDISRLSGAAAADGAGTASPAFALLRRARAEVANGSARWTWMPPGKAAIVPLDGAAQEWLARVAQAAGTRWTDTTERAGPGDALEARWWRDDWPQATLRIESDGLRWIEHNGHIRHAPLDAATLQRLRSP